MQLASPARLRAAPLCSWSTELSKCTPLPQPPGRTAAAKPCRAEEVSREYQLQESVLVSKSRLPFKRKPSAEPSVDLRLKIDLGTKTTSRSALFFQTVWFCWRSTDPGRKLLPGLPAKGTIGTPNVYHSFGCPVLSYTQEGLLLPHLSANTAQTSQILGPIVFVKPSQVQRLRIAEYKELKLSESCGNKGTKCILWCIILACLSTKVSR